MEDSNLNEELKNPSMFLWKHFGILQTPEIHCRFAELFRKRLREHPLAIEELCALLCDPASVDAVRLGMKRLLAHPAPEFADKFFYSPSAMMTDGERADWDAHLRNFPEYHRIFHHVFEFYEPTEFYYRHGLIYLDRGILDRLKGTTFIDAGAFNGASSLVMSLYSPESILAFEPSRANFQTCRTVLDIGRVHANCTLLQSCLGKHEGAIRFRDDGNSAAAVSGDGTEVPVVPLDKIVAERHVARVGWIKADLEGAAMDMILGAKETILRDRPLLTLGTYHCPEEFFDIPKLLHEWVPDYQFAVRRCQCHPANTYNELTLIAFIPGDLLAPADRDTLARHLTPERNPVLFFTHPLNWPGGATAFAKQKLAAWQTEHRPVLVVSPEPERVILELHDGPDIFRCAMSDLKPLLREPVFRGISEIELNNFVSWHLPFGTPNVRTGDFQSVLRTVTEFARLANAPIRYYFHDFFSICPLAFLFNADGRPCGGHRGKTQCADCLRRIGRSDLGYGVDVPDITAWRKLFESFFHACSELRYFSNSTRAIMEDAIPSLKSDLAASAVVRGHTPTETILPQTWDTSRVRVIGIAGILGPVKGASLILKLAEYLQTAAPEVKIVIFGEIAAAPLPTNLSATGRYAPGTLASLLHKHDVNVGFFSSLWPETFSFVTLELMSMNLPLVCFDLGAQAERVKTYERGAIIPDLTPESVWQTIQSLMKKIENARAEKTSDGRRDLSERILF